MELSRNNKVDVLIAGAGPAGLMMACQLDLHHISFRIIDKKSSPAIHSGALIVHARTLEILHQVGLAEKAIKAGIIAQTINLQFNQFIKYSLNIKDIGKGSTRFPYILMLEQWKTENLLGDFLNEQGHSIENNTPFLSFRQENDLIISKILKPDGTIEMIESRFLIGADGSNSRIRKKLNIPFPGKTQQSSLFITDCESQLTLPSCEISFSFCNEFTSALFPLRGNRWRIDGLIPVIQYKELNFEHVKNFFSAKNHLGLEIQHPQWFSAFRSQSRCANSFRLKRCFLIGDAAHVHSPVGAQGMNTGIQDAHNLAWKLAYSIRGKATENLLDTYEEERRPLVLNIIRYTDLAYKLMTSNFFLIRFSRLKIIPLFMPMFLSYVQRYSGLRNRLFTSLSGIGIKYKHSFLSCSTTSDNFPHLAPSPGDRLPYVTYQDNGNLHTLYDGLNSSTFNLFIFGRKVIPASLQTVVNKYKDVISVIYIAKEVGTQRVFKKLGIMNEGCYLIRPDHFIAWRSQDFNALSFGNFLQKFLK